MSRWEKINGKYLLDVLGDDADAQLQKVSIWLDPVEKCIEWHINGEIIRLRPDLPTDVIDGPFATSFGYEWNCEQGIVYGIGDVSLTKLAGVLSEFGLQGVQMYVIVPNGVIPNTPTIRIEKIDILDGRMAELNLIPQGVLSAQDIEEGCGREHKWVDDSLVIEWKGKRNNNASALNSNHMNGKIIHKAPPLAHPLVVDGALQAGNASNRSFGAAGGSETVGVYEVLPTGTQKTFDRQELVDKRGVGTHYAFAATLGYIAEGLSSIAIGFGFPAYYGPYAITPGDYEILSYHRYTGAEPVSSKYNVYDVDGGDLPVNTLGTDTPISPNPTSVGWHTTTLSSPDPITTTTALRLGAVISSTLTTYYDAGASDVLAFDRDYDWDDALPDPATVAGGDVRNRQESFYITYQAASTGIIPQIMHHRRMMRQ